MRVKQLFLTLNVKILGCFLNILDDIDVLCVSISFLCLNSRPYSVPQFLHCSQMRPWPCTSLSVALYSTAALSGRDSMTCFPASL